MVSNTTALWFTLLGTLGGALLGVIGTVTIAVSGRRHEQWMYWLENQRVAFTEQVNRTTAFIRAVSLMLTMRRRCDDDPEQIPQRIIDRVISAGSEMNAHAHIDRLFCVQNRMTRVRNDLTTARAEVALWLPDASGNRVRSTYKDRTPRTTSVEVALSQLKAARNAYLLKAVEQLGIARPRRWRHARTGPVTSVMGPGDGPKLNG